MARVFHDTDTVYDVRWSIPNDQPPFSDEDRAEFEVHAAAVNAWRAKWRVGIYAGT